VDPIRIMHRRWPYAKVSPGVVRRISYACPFAGLPPRAHRFSLVEDTPQPLSSWIPAFAGMTKSRGNHIIGQPPNALPW
jgi:hypothetical protein